MTQTAKTQTAKTQTDTEWYPFTFVHHLQYERVEKAQQCFHGAELLQHSLTNIKWPGFKRIIPYNFTYVASTDSQAESLTHLHFLQLPSFTFCLTQKLVDERWIELFIPYFFLPHPQMDLDLSIRLVTTTAADTHFVSVIHVTVLEVNELASLFQSISLQNRLSLSALKWLCVALSSFLPVFVWLSCFWSFLFVLRFLIKMQSEEKGWGAET